MAAHHPTQEMLLSYAAGSMDEPAALLVAAHLTLCPGCRFEVSRYETLGGLLLEQLPPESIGPDCLESIFRRLEQERENGSTNEARAVSEAGLPRPLGRYLDGGLDRLRWRWLMPGLRMADLNLGRSGARAGLMRARAGAKIPRHSHGGTEAILVLSGGFADERGHCRRGDVWLSDETVTHSQVIDAGEDCLCLVVIDGPIRLTGPLGWALNHFQRF